MEEVERSDFERTMDLRPVSEMSAEDVKTEIAKANADPKHPYWDERHPSHKQAINRMGLLWRAHGPTKSPLAKSLEEIGIKTKEDLVRIQEQGFAEIDREKTRREWEKLRDKLALASPGRPKEEFNEMLERAQGTFKILREQKILGEDIAEFMDDGVGAEPQILQLFADISKLQARYGEWKAKKAK